MTEDEQLSDLKKIFGTKQILSARDVGELVGLSVGTMANQRCSNCSLIPSKKFGKRVGFHVKDVAKFLVYGTCESVIPQETQNLAKPINARGGITKNRNWLLAKKVTIELNREMIEVAFEVFENKDLRDKILKKIEPLFDEASPKKPRIL